MVTKSAPRFGLVIEPALLKEVRIEAARSEQSISEWIVAAIRKALPQ